MSALSRRLRRADTLRVHYYARDIIIRTTAVAAAGANERVIRYAARPYRDATTAGSRVFFTTAL